MINALFSTLVIFPINAKDCKFAAELVRLSCNSTVRKLSTRGELTAGQAMSAIIECDNESKIDLNSCEEQAIHATKK